MATANERRGPRRPRLAGSAEPRPARDLLLSFGGPMLLGGDEFGRTQRGNNNAYSQDNPISWFDWTVTDNQLTEFTRKVIALRRAHPVFRRQRFLTGIEAAELVWYTPAGTQMTEADWRTPYAHSIALYLDDADLPDQSPDGVPLVDDDFLLLVNAWWEPLDFTAPATRPGQTSRPVLDTYEPSGTPVPADFGVADQVAVRPRSLVLLQGQRD